MLINHSLTQIEIFFWAFGTSIVVSLFIIGIVEGIKALWLSTFPKHEWSEETTLTGIIMNIANPDGSHPTMPFKGKYCLKCGKSRESTSYYSKSEEIFYRTKYKCIKGKYFIKEKI